MRWQLILTPVKSTEITPRLVCPYEGCQGVHIRFFQEVRKPVRDTVCEAVVAHRYRCLRCRRTFRVYPPGASRDETSQRAKGLAVMLYLLGLSYGAVSLALDALGVYL